MKRLITVWVRSYGQKGLAAVGLAVLTVAWLMTTASAHALLLKSDPEHKAVLEQAPEQVGAWFGEELETQLSQMQVFNAQEKQIDSGDGRVDLTDPDHASMLVSLPESLSNGTYTVRWRAVSADDGDATEGEFFFDVTSSEATTGPALESSPSPAGNEADFPVVELVVAIGFLLAILTGLLLYPRLARRR